MNEAIDNRFIYIIKLEFKGMKIALNFIKDLLLYFVKGFYETIKLFFTIMFKLCLYFYIGIKEIVYHFYLGVKDVTYHFYVGLKTIGKFLFFIIKKPIYYFVKGNRIMFNIWFKFNVRLIDYFILGIVVVFNFIFDLFGYFYKGIAAMFKPLVEYPIKLQEKRFERTRDKKEKELLEASKTKYGYSEMKEEDEIPLFKKLMAIPDRINNWGKEKFASFGFVKYFENKKMMDSEELLIDFDSEDSVRSEVKKLFKYKAKNPDGKIVSDSFAAFSKVDVHSFLLSEGFEVYEIEEDKMYKLFKIGRIDSGNKKLPAKDLIFWTTQLSTYIKAGIPLIEGIKILARQAKKDAYKSIFQSMTYELIMGGSFSDALDKQGKTFPRLYVNMMKTAEMTGELPETLDDMADYYDAIEKTRKQVMSAMIYPIVVFIFSIGVVIFIVMSVVPQFVEMYKDLGAELPVITKATISFSEFLGSYWLYLIIGVVSVVTIFKLLYANVKFFRTIVQWLLMRIPFFGNVIIYKEVNMFAKTFSTLQKNSIFITDSMSILSKITSNEIYKMLIFDTITNLGKGDTISKAFKDNWAFPEIAYHMLVTGEKTGQTAEMMGKVADFYQEEETNAVTKMKSLLEPIVMIFLSVVVGIILLAVITPMFSMYDGIM